MMKKLLLLSSALFVFSFGAKSQIFVNGPTVVTDTLTYFVNKQQFKIGQPMNNAYPYYKAPTAASVNSATYVTHCGSIFKNQDTALMVTGIEGWASKNKKNFNSINPIPVHLYLCKLGANGMPILPAIDSIWNNVYVNNACEGTTDVCPPQLVGGNFASPRKVSGDFAVLMRNFSTQSGDTVRMFRTSTLTHNSNVLTGPGAEFYKTGEALGVIRQNGIWNRTTDYTSATGFGGIGTDYEFCVAPRVQFTLTVGSNAPSNAGAACVFDILSYTNTSSPEITNKQFNLNEFYRQMKPFQAQPSADALGFTPDTVMQWDFGDDPRIDTLPHLWGRVQNQFLSANTNFINKAFDTTGVFLNGRQIGSYRKMNALYYGLIRSTTTFSTAVDPCGREVNVGFQVQTSVDNVNIFPNPAVNSKVTVNGLSGKNTIQVFNILGQVVLTEATDKQNTVVDLSKQPSGTYTIRITGPDNRAKVVKIVNLKD